MPRSCSLPWCGSGTSGCWCSNQPIYCAQPTYNTSPPTQQVKVSRDVFLPPEFDEALANRYHAGVEYGGIDAALGVLETDVRFGARRDDVQVNVGDFHAGDDDHGAWNAEHQLLRLADALSHDGKVGEGIFVELCELRNLRARHHQHVAVVNWLVGSEGDADVVRPSETARDFSSNDFGEDTHGPILRVAPATRRKRVG